MFLYLMARDALLRLAPLAQHLGDDRRLFRVNAPQPVPLRVADFDRAAGLRDGPRLFFRQHDVRHGIAFLRRPVYAAARRRVKPTALPLQCPTYFAYSARALSTSLVPLMIARPSGNTVNSWPSAVNFSRKRL